MTICGLTIWLMLVTGGLTHYPENPAFLLVLPVIALLCINRMAAIVWLAIAVLILCAFGIATINGIQFPMSMNQKYIALFEVFSFPGLVILTIVFVIIFDNAKNAALGKLEGQAKVIAWEKQKSEELLLNILPSGVADELKENGKAKAHRFDDVSILFTDFVNFTGTAEQMTAEQLVQELHECFTAFDLIMEKYGMEKIKTVGDAYLAVCGLPAPDPEHARKTVLAALDIRDFIEERKKQENAFSIRIGIHSGSVVAGIVGVKKFAYDIWGDTVNTAARMEQSGESGKVNISGTTYEFIKDQFNCVYRGEIAAKNKGKMNMYFVAGTINH
jgi:class 3 adenylate cyclase